MDRKISIALMELVSVIGINARREDKQTWYVELPLLTRNEI